MALKVYAYSKCGTCRKALKYLKKRGIEYTIVAIRERPPSKAELRRMLKYQGGHLRRLFNTSGGDYKELNMKERLGELSEAEAIDFLAGRGNLIKRPFVQGEDFGLVGFKQDEWDAALR